MSNWSANQATASGSAATLRVWLPILIVACQGEFLPACRRVASLSWVPIILRVEWMVRREWKPSYVLADGSASARLAAGQ
jgi:hypothetical protein